MFIQNVFLNIDTRLKSQVLRKEVGCIPILSRSFCTLSSVMQFLARTARLVINYSVDLWPSLTLDRTKYELEFPERALERSVPIVAHPDDEVLWFGSILEQVDRIIICYVGA